ncbi:MAG: LLM class flavin-dependent oxidoreductase [Myxococcota bacterium]|nr:LLM class flavin-dependent oxidoreductase [Myxococcota bacterium]
MRFVFWPGPHASFAEVLALATRAEALGFGGVAFADHFLPAAGDPARPTLECWSVLAAIAARVPRVSIVPLVCGVTYRSAHLLAKLAATVDHVSGGRLVLGIGAAWQENEHRAYGIAFPPIGERLARLDETCFALRSLFERPTTTLEGRHVVLREAVLEPKPVQPRLPLLVGGGGERTTLRIAATHADVWNTWGTPELLRRKNALLDRHCGAVGRDPRAIRRSAVSLFHLTDESAEAKRLRAATRMPCVAGDAAEIRDAVAAYAAAGVDEIVVPDFAWGRGAERLAALDRFGAAIVQRA